MASTESVKETSTTKVAEANNYLGINMYRLLSKKEGNIFFSPFSLSTAFAMLFYGAEMETAEEMRNVLGYEIAKIEDQELKTCYQKLLDEIEKSPDSYTLSSANSVVTQDKSFAPEKYKLLLEEFFKARFWEVDFKRDIQNSIKLINEWVSQKTQKMIPEFLKDLSPATVMVILNAVYFKGFWLHQFSTEKTTLQKFNIRGEENNIKKVEMMHNKESFSYFQNQQYKALELPYKGGDISMLILLPNVANGLKDLESSLSYDFISDLKQKMFEIKVDVAIPKFKIDISKSMVKDFQALGMVRVFDSVAQLGGICDGLYVTDVIHQAVIEVNEEGSEAAAATAIIIWRSISRTPEFIADHPFLFLIYNTKSNLIYFMGRVEEP